MKKLKTAIATGIIATTAIVGVALIPEDPENLPILEQIAFYENILEEKIENGEGTTITIQKINELELKLK